MTGHAYGYLSHQYVQVQVGVRGEDGHGHA